jgi:hypothetical protein
MIGMAAAARFLYLDTAAAAVGAAAADKAATVVIP